jgi:hypothetical protein
MLFNVRGFESAVVERVEVIDADDVAPVSKETVEGSKWGQTFKLNLSKELTV